MTQLSPSDLALYRAVDEVLHYLWDPIGVAGMPEARGEYHGYLPRVFGMLKDGANEAQLSQFLCSITTERMGLSARLDHDRVIASQLMAWKMAIDNCQG